MTLISDVVVPEVTADYLMDDLAVANLMFSSGIVKTDPMLASLLNMGGSKFSFPYWGDITAGESDIPVEGTAATARKIGTYELTIPRQMRKIDVGAGKLASILAGANAMNAINVRVSTLWKTDMQNNLIATIKGIIGSTDGAKITLDKAAQAGAAAPTTENYIDADYIIDAQALLGDNTGKFNAIVLHTSVLTAMRKANLIATQALSDQSGYIETYQNMVVINDDNVPTFTRTDVGTTDHTVYATLLIKEAAFVFGESTNGFVPVYIDTDHAKGMGEETLYTKRMFALHPAGWDWTGTAAGLAPTNTELATGTNWALKMDHKMSGFVALLTN